MSNFPKRDTTGNCEGECRDRVREGEEERQTQINSQRGDNEGGSPSARWASNRNAPPGYLGGHV